MEPLDPQGSIVLALSVAVLFMLVLGLPLVRGINNKKNLKRHGILTAVGLTAQTVIVIASMITKLPGISQEIMNLQPSYALTVWLHFITGFAALALGFVLIGLWLTASSSQMRCMRAKKYMLPTLILWIAALIAGALIHLQQIL